MVNLLNCWYELWLILLITTLYNYSTEYCQSGSKEEEKSPKGGEGTIGQGQDAEKSGRRQKCREGYAKTVESHCDRARRRGKDMNRDVLSSACFLWPLGLLHLSTHGRVSRRLWVQNNWFHNTTIYFLLGAHTYLCSESFSDRGGSGEEAQRVRSVEHCLQGK